VRHALALDQPSAKHLGHQVIVANARKLRAISQNESKNDKADAEMLARLALSDSKLLSPLKHRSLERQRDLNLIRARDVLVRARTMLVNAVRCLAKSAGGRLPACATDNFIEHAKPALPAELKNAAAPLLAQIASLTKQIHHLDGEIEKLSERYLEIALLRPAPGVGPLVAAAYVLTLDRADAVSTSRAAGAFLGLRPRQSQSGDSDPEHRITKSGNIYLRKLLVQSAHYILGRFGPDSALRRWGLRLAGAGQKPSERAAAKVCGSPAINFLSHYRKATFGRPLPGGEYSGTRQPTKLAATDRKHGPHFSGDGHAYRGGCLFCPLRFEPLSGRMVPNGRSRLSRRPLLFRLRPAGGRGRNRGGDGFLDRQGHRPPFATQVFAKLPYGFVKSRHRYRRIDSGAFRPKRVEPVVDDYTSTVICFEYLSG
jgi:transposase